MFFTLNFLVLNVSNQELVSFLVNNEFRAAIIFPKINILFEQSAIRFENIISKYQSYININFI
jgi:hypothetical protein